MLRLEGAQLNYGSFRALDGITIHADPGELVVMLGANGAGKSSLFLAISGLRKLSRGNIWFKDQNIAGRKPSQSKNLLLGAYVHRQDRSETQKILDQVFEMFPILFEKRNDAAGSLSGGQQQMVAIGRALMGRPEVLLLDEPSLGLAPLVVKQVLGVIKAINDNGTTVLLAEQNAYAALQIAHRAYVIESGRIVMEGDRETLLNDERVRKAYIGA
jgi:branched-chain amino acid transport system ATP-binding protein